MNNNDKTTDITAGADSLDRFVGLCSKPGCGASARIGKPCTDYNCPQRWVKAEEYQKLKEELEKIKRENEYLWNKH